MTACSCGQPLQAEDRFCPGCGKVARMQADRPVLSVATTGFQWRWALMTIPIVIGVTFACMFTLGVLASMAGVNLEAEGAEETLGTLGAIAGIFVGGAVVGWWSPGRTVLEPAVGIAATLATVNVFVGDLGDVIFGWILPFLVGAGGARLGEWIQSISLRAEP